LRSSLHPDKYILPEEATEVVKKPFQNASGYWEEIQKLHKAQEATHLLK
jgi:hypothetical protein